MRLLEELQMNALPSLQTILYDGWILRFADGYTNRANSVNPIYQSQENIHEKINRCEKIFRNKGFRPTFKITPFIYPENLDGQLENRGYKMIHSTSVKTLHMSNLIEPYMHLAVTSSHLEDTWFDHYCDFNKTSVENSKIYKKMLNNLIPQRFLTSLMMDNEVIACGMAVLEKIFFGLFDITVSENHRNKGYGKQLLLNMLKVGKDQGAEIAYLQVMQDNLPALHLYRELGFEEEYQYYYRILTD